MAVIETLPLSRVQDGSPWASVGVLCNENICMLVLKRITAIRSSSCLCYISLPYRFSMHVAFASRYWSSCVLWQFRLFSLTLKWLRRTARTSKPRGGCNHSCLQCPKQEMAWAMILIIAGPSCAGAATYTWSVWGNKLRKVSLCVSYRYFFDKSNITPFKMMLWLTLPPAWPNCI